MQINSLESTIVIPDQFEKTFSSVLKKDFARSRFFIVVDTNTRKLCLPLLANIAKLKDAVIIEVPDGEDNKSTTSLIAIWEALSKNGADRQSVVINLGGGVLCDMGGFAAATFKRGISFINIPTTLLSQVDASVGGKLGINFNGLKNEVGLFKVADYVFINTDFLKTLDYENLISGFAEMIKHAIINSLQHWNKLEKTTVKEGAIDYAQINKLIVKSIFIKNDFVQRDPAEKDIRKALNFGHTIGHAFESFLLHKGHPVLHGIAVAHGMVCEAYLSYSCLKLSKNSFERIANYVLKHYPPIQFHKNDFEELYRLMMHDKKNKNNKINFTLIPEIGNVSINQKVLKRDVFKALQYHLEMIENL